MQLRTGLAIVLACVSSGVIGYADTHMKTDDNLPSVLLLISVAFLFGLAQPKWAWGWALIIGLGVPASHLIGLLFGYRPPYPVEPNVMITFIALVPSFVGAYLGVFATTVVRLILN
jgi:NO-binding membrane sensor protein with MHYT domain